MRVSNSLGRIRLPFKFLASQLAQDEDFIDDMKSLLQVEDKQFSVLLNTLTKYEGFLDQAQLKAELKSVWKDESPDDIAEIIYRLGGIVHDSDLPSSKATEFLCDAIRSETTSLKEEEKKTLIIRIELLANSAGIAKQYKANRLAEAISGELKSFQIICDIRPIFDGDRKHIDGAIPVSTARLEYALPDGDSEVIEFRVTSRSLKDIKEAVDTAQLKMDALQNMLLGNNIRVPKTSSNEVAE